MKIFSKNNSRNMIISTHMNSYLPLSNNPIVMVFFIIKQLTLIIIVFYKSSYPVSIPSGIKISSLEFQEDIFQKLMICSFKLLHLRKLNLCIWNFKPYNYKLIGYLKQSRKFKEIYNVKKIVLNFNHIKNSKLTFPHFSFQ